MVDGGTKGAIVNVASILGLRVAGAVAPYAISKAGKALVRRVPQRRLGNLAKLDGPLLLLLSDAGSFMTGSTVTVDGGHLVSSL